MKKQIKYIDGNVLNGIEIDWNYIYKQYLGVLKKVVKSKEVLDGIYIPKPPLNSANWFFECSERSVGKTTNYLIIGLILWRDYGIKTEYIRLNKDGIMPKNASKLFDTIREYGYIEAIFDNWNDVNYNRHRGYNLCMRDEDGKVAEQQDAEFMHLHCLDSAEVDAEKSVYNSPLGDWILFDEAIPVTGITTEQQFLNLMQLHSTIRRQRLSTRTIVLANTINKYTHLFEEFEIRKPINSMRMGESKIIETRRGVSIWFHLIKFNEVITEKRLINNLKFYGFSNPKLSSIIGGEEWETKNYPHLLNELRKDHKNIIKNRLFFRIYDDILCFDIMENDEFGRFAMIHRHTEEPREDSIVYTLAMPTRKNENYKMRSMRKIEVLISDLYKQNRVFYASNECGSLFEFFIDSCDVK